jgi:signal-transduction protein with cAMP-binding, CBS, and nucleotidyltransferase domain
MEVQYYTSGCPVITQNDYHSGFFIILDGEVEVIDKGRLVVTLKTNEYFGDVSIFLEVNRNSGSIIATKFSKIGHIT